MRIAPIARAVALGAALIAALLAAPRAALAGPHRLVVVHTNDIHGHLLPGPDYLTPGEPKPVLGGIAAAAAFIESERAAAARDGAGFLYLDAGDVFHGAPEGDLDRDAGDGSGKRLPHGFAITEALALLTPDAVCIGNHELAYGEENFEILARQAGFQFISGNCAHADASVVPPWKPYVIRETGGMRIAIIGLTTDATPRMNVPGACGDLEFEKPQPALRRLLGQVAGEHPDLVIALTHLGSEEDVALARAVTGCALIVGGHDHVALEPARLVGETLIVQAGEQLRRIGEVKLEFDDAMQHIVSRRSVLVNLTADMPRSPTVAACVDARRRKELDVQVGAAAEPILRGFSGESEAGSLACEAIRELLHADCAMFNHTTVRGGFERGAITGRDVYECVPFQNQLCSITLTGDELASLLEDCVARAPSEPTATAAPRGRGRNAGDAADLNLESAGLRVRFDPDRPRGSRVVEAIVNGAPLDRSRSYSLATTGFFAELTHNYPTLAGKPRRDDIRTPYDALIAWFAKHSPARAPPIGRFAPTPAAPRPARDSSRSGRGADGGSGGDSGGAPARTGPQTPTTNASSSNRVEIEILHTNDVHGQVYPVKAVWSRQPNPPMYGGYVALASFIDAERERARAAGKGFLLLDAGDCWQGTPEGNLTEGRLSIEWMNLVGYDAMAIGNHEFDAGPQAVPGMAARARFPFLSANLLDQVTGKRPTYAQSRVVREIAGVKVAIIGLTTDECKKVSLPQKTEGLDFAPAIDTAREEVAAARAAGAEVVIIVSHCGDAPEHGMAGGVAGIDAICGGHTHKAIDPPYVDETTGTILQRIDSKGLMIGRIRLVYDRKAKRVVERAGDIVQLPSADFPHHEATERLIAAYAVTINAVMDVPLGTAEVDIVRRSGYDSSALGDWVCDVMRDVTHADVALMNKAGIRADIPKGPVRLREVYQVLPFGNTCFTLRLTGRQLMDELTYALSDKRWALDVSGIVVRYDLERPPSDRLVALLVGGKPVELSRSYVVCTNSFLATAGDGHTLLGAGEDRVDTGIDLMRAQADDARRRGSVRIADDGRIAPAEATMPAKKD